MFTTTTAVKPEMSANVETASLDSTLLELASETAVELAFAGFDYSFSAPLVELSPIAGSRRVLVKVAVDEAINLVCGMKVKPSDNGEDARFDDEVKIHFETVRPGPRADFVGATLKPLFWLAETVRLQIPAFQLEARLKFAAPLGEVGPTLRRRMMAHRLMLIERACGARFLMPQPLSRVEEDQITFAWHAIADRSLDWPFDQGSFSFKADEQTREMLAQAEQSGVFKFEASPFDCEVLDQRLALGRAIVTLEGAALVDAEEVRRETERMDGHEFQAAIRTTKGAIWYEFPAAPRLAEVCWDERMLGLINLELPLDQRFFQIVNGFAAGSLAGLTEEEMDELTAPLQLGEEAFLDPEI
jgi:hypothetical protein